MCFNQTEHELKEKKRCGFCDIISRTLLLYLCKIQCMYACEWSRPDVAPPMEKVKKEKKRKKYKKKKKGKKKESGS